MKHVSVTVFTSLIVKPTIDRMIRTRQNYCFAWLTYFFLFALDWQKFGIPEVSVCCVLYSVGPEVCSLVHCLLYQSPQSSSRHHLASISLASHHQLNQIGPLIAFIIYLYHSITYQFWGVLLNKYVLKLIMLSKFQVFSPYLTYLIFINLLVYFSFSWFNQDSFFTILPNSLMES